MTANTIYDIISAGLLLWVASFWSTSGLLNMFVKACFTGAALFGAVCVAKNVI